MSEDYDIGTDSRPIRYLEDDWERPGKQLVVYRASAIGGCPRALIASGLAYDPKPKPEWFQDVLDEGSRMETVINDAWEAKTGVPTTNQQMRVELLIGVINDQRVIVRGHIDGQEGFDPVGREYKKFRPSTWNNFLMRGVECNTMYPWQAAVMMHATDWAPWQFVGGKYNPDTDTIDDVDVKMLYNPPIPLHAIKVKVARIERAINQGENPTQTACAPLMFPCGWYYLHDMVDDELPEITDDILMERIQAYAKVDTEHKKLAKESRAVDKERKSIAEAIKARMVELNVADSEGRGGATLGLYDVTGKMMHRDGYTVNPTDYWQVSVTKLSGKPDDRKG